MVDAWKIFKVSKRGSRALGWEDIRDVWGYARSLEGVNRSRILGMIEYFKVNI